MMETKKRVLAAEDSPTQAAVLRSHLEGAGFDVSVATNGAEALHLMTSETFDLVVSDIVMPDVDGYDLCRGVKERYPTVPVVLLTSMADPLDVVNALAAGADNFLRKPYEPEELVHRIANMLHNKQLRESGRTQMGLELFFLGRRFMINADREQILDLLVSTFEDLVAMNHRLRAREEDLAVVHQELATRLTEASLERDRLTGVLRAMPAGMAVFDTEGRIINGNQRLADLAGRPLSALQGAVVWDVIEFVDHAGAVLAQEHRALSKTLCEGRGATVGTAFDLFIERPDGDRIPVLARTEPICAADGRVMGAVGTLEDLRGLMDHDPVTGFAGHGILADRLTAAATMSSERGLATGMVVIVLDRYERIRQSLPGTGEQVMAAVATRLRESLGSEEIRQRTPTASAAYLGNGELVVVLPDLAGRADAVAVAHLLTSQLADTVEVEGTAVSVAVSAAIGMCDDGTDAASLVASVAASARNASIAGGGRVAGIEDAANVEVMDLLRRESELRSAIDTGQLTVHYQPQVRVRDQSPVAIEALVRWQHPERGLLGAAEVIPLAVETGLISAVGWLVLEEACRHVGEWSKEFPDHLRPTLSVNLAAEQLADDDIVARVDRVLAETGFDPNWLVLEITEGTVMGDPDAARQRLTALKALGVRMAIDDFGTGYSSLLQLRRLPIDVLKIDRVFIAGMLEEPADAAIVSATIRLARALGLEVVAEGVENADELVQLRVLGCDVGQGYLWARPMPGEALAAWWSAHATGPHIESLVDPLDSETDDQQDEAISYLVHELRSPLAAISGFAELLQEASASEASTEFLDAIVRNAHELESRLESLREANDLLRGGLTLQPEDRDVGDLVKTLVHDLAPDLHPQRVDVSSTGAACASVDAVRLTQAVSNLITNAAKFTPAGAPIEVNVTGTGTLVEITVRDHGPGVPEHRRPELFRRFSRLGAKSSGMGLGLYLCRLMIDAHGGVVRYDDAPGGGAMFSIRLPQRSNAACAGGAGHRSPSDSVGVNEQLSTAATILCIDDDASTVELIERVLATNAALRVLSARDGVTGLELASTHRPDLVLLDLNIGDPGGEELLDRLRSEPGLDLLPVVVLSADADEATAARLLEAGAAEVLRKPFRPEHLRYVVRKAIVAENGRTGLVSEWTSACVEGPLDPDMVSALVELDADSKDGDGIDRVVHDAISSAHDRLESMESAASSHDTDDLRRHAHALGGAVANLGAHVVAQRCRDLDSAAERGDPNAIENAVDGVAKALAEAEDALFEHFPLE